MANDADVGVKVIDVAADAVVANEADNGINVIDVAAEAVVAKDELPNSEPVIPPETPKLPDTANDPEVVNDPVNTTMSVVSSNDPVIVWVPLKELDPVVANIADDVLFSNLEFCANDAVVANDAVDGVNVILFAALAVVANDDDVLLNALNCVELLITPLNLFCIRL